MQTEKNLKLQNLEDDLNLLKLQHNNLTKDYNYLLTQNKEGNTRLTKITEERDLLMIKISQLNSRISQNEISENNKIKSNEQLTEEIFQLREDFNELLKDRDYWRDLHQRYKFDMEKQNKIAKENFETSMKERNGLHEQVLILIKERNDLKFQLENLNKINKKNEDDLQLNLYKVKNYEKENEEIKAENKNLLEIIKKLKNENFEFNELKKINEKNLQNIEFLKIENANQKKKIDLLTAEKEKLISQINELNLIVTNLEISIKNYLNSLEKLKKEKEDLLNIIGNLNKEKNLMKINCDGHLEKILILENLLFTNFKIFLN